MGPVPRIIAALICLSHTQGRRVQRPNYNVNKYQLHKCTEYKYKPTTLLRLGLTYTGPIDTGPIFIEALYVQSYCPGGVGIFTLLVSSLLFTTAEKKGLFKIQSWPLTPYSNKKTTCGWLHAHKAERRLHILARLSETFNYHMFCVSFGRTSSSLPLNCRQARTQVEVSIQKTIMYIMNAYTHGSLAP